MEKRQKRIQYKRNWRQIEKQRKRTNSFIVEYTRIKFPYVHNEAINFYSALKQLYPDKDAKKTKEFKAWKEAIINPQEPDIIVNHLYTDVSYEEKATEKATESDNNSDTESDSDNNNSDNNNSDTENDDNNNNNDTESDNNNNNDTESDDNNNSDTEMNSNQKNFQDNMLLEIPLGVYSDNQNENNQSIVSDEPPNAPFNNEYDFEAFSDERLREIVNELRDDPELRNIFWEQENDSADEGVELKTLEEEVELDFEPFDYRLEVELADW